MSSEILTTGLTGAKFADILCNGFRQTNPAALGVAVAYISVSGFDYINGLVKKHKVRQFKLVADTRDAITHPMALANALEGGWDVRTVGDLPGTFHPKLFVGGSRFVGGCAMEDASWVVAGSANLSAAALNRNGECSYVHIGSTLAQSANVAWQECWQAGKKLDGKRLAAYEKFFETRNRHRRPEDLVTLGIADQIISTKNGRPEKGKVPPPRAQRVIPATAATVAWAGLESFTGDYNLQVEFPRDAGAVLSRILGDETNGNSANLLCDDGEERQFIFRYYHHNGMFRLNVPNSTPGATWARAHKQGIAVVEADEEDDGIRFRIVALKRDMLPIIQRSLALGTWGKTSTRLYGWY
jgi:HKD family nuclease